MLILGGQSTHNLERIHEDIARITSDNVDPGESIGPHNLERICEDIARITSDNVDPGVNQHTTWNDPWRHGKDYPWQCWSWGVDWHTTLKGSMRTLQGLPLRMLILGSIITQLGMIHEDMARITSDNVDPGGSIDIQLGKDPWGHCKDYLWQCWNGGCESTHNLERIHEDIARITSDNVDPGGQSTHNLEGIQWGHCKDYLWQCWPWRGQSTHNLERICKDMARITSDNVDPGGWLTHNLERINKDIARITSDNVDPGVDWHTTWKGSTRTLQGLPLTMLILGDWLTHNLERIHEDIARITSNNVDPGGWLTHNLERIHRDIARITSDNVDSWGGWLTHNLERICEDITRITSE